MIQGALYYRAAGGSLTRCVNKREAEKLLQGLHAETCGQTGAAHLYRKLQRMGIYCPSMSAQAATLQDSCADFQAPPQPAEVFTIEEIDWRQPYIDFIQHRKLPSDRQTTLKIQRRRRVSSSMKACSTEKSMVTPHCDACRINKQWKS